MKLKSIMLELMIVLAIGTLGQTGQAADKPAASLHQAARAVDPALATTPVAAIFGHKEKKLIVIDVRPQSEFDRFRISGSLNMPLHAIKTKAYLKTKPIVLVNEGFVVGPLAETCRTLNGSGFKATILAGGLMAWKQKGGGLIGDPFAQNRMNHITPLLLEQEKASTSVKLINASDPKDLANDNLIPDVRNISLLKSNKNVAELQKLMKAKSSDPFGRLVIVTATGKENDRIQRRLAQDGIYQAFFLDGGLKAYEEYLQRIQLARRSVEERKVSTGGCRTCPQN